ncbi:MFS transporter [Sulfitobacter sp. G21635-S1]|uniref:MFS transporter n=1 Tax=Sulfitobacter sp. G21635-S1 TaxID=3014043 RepID=UPI0022AF5FA4|nr:MFS transporter [Sulfitobacter sp. G21635-S1]MCZ4255453.1 MFS transporter [Sulfitobacter sp. G21635-S1]
MTPQTILLFLIAFLVGSDEFLLGPILTPIGADLGVAPERVTLFIGAYALPLALLSPVLGGLSDRIGRRRVLLPSVVLFCLGSLGTALAPGFGAALATRVLTGIGAAGMLPIAFASAADSGPSRAPANIAAVQAGLTTGIILAPLYGSAVTNLLGWHWAFAGLAAAGAVSVLGLRWLPGGVSHGGAAPMSGPILVPGAFSAILAMGLGLGGAIGILAIAGERIREITDLGTGGVGAIYAGFGVATLAGNLLMPLVMGGVRDGRQLVQLCLIGVLAAIAAFFALPLGLVTASLAMALWAVLGGLGAPGLQTYLAGLSESRIGVLMALGASAMNLGVAVWSAVAASLFAVGSILVAGLALTLIGIACIALMPPKSARAPNANH